MSNNTEIYWEASGVSLHTYAWSVKTFGGSRNSVPEKRGENFRLPFRPGQKRTKKYRDAKPLALPMWIAPCDPDGNPDFTMSEEAKMQSNWEYVMSLFDTEDEFPLVKRFYKDGVVKAVTAMAEMLETPEPTVVAQNTLDFTVNLVLADPYFYEPVAAQAVGAVTIEGNAPTDHIVLTLDGGQRVTSPDGNWIQYDGPGTAVIDCHNGTAKQGATFVNGLVSRNLKFPEWMRLQPGLNALVGAGTIEYEAAYK